MGVIGKLINYGVRALKATPKLIFGTGSDAVGSAMRTTVKGMKGASIFAKGKAAAKAGLKTLESGATGKAFLKGVAKDIIGLPKALMRSSKAGYLIAKHAGKSGIWGGIKGFFGGAAKKMPLIGTLLMIGCELPNIFKAGSEEGVGSALTETAKAGARLAGGAAGAAIGSAICPGIGSLIGWVAGEWLTSKVVGKSYSEKKEEEEEQAQQAQQEAQYEQFKQLGLSDEEIQYCIENGYTPEQVAEAKAQEQAQQPAQTQGATQPAAQQPAATNPIDYTSTYNPYMFGGFNPFMTPTFNSYSNDMFYAQLFSNPYIMGAMGYNPFGQVQYDPTQQFFRYTA